MKSIKYIVLSFTALVFIQCTDLEEENFTFLSTNDYYSTGDELATSLISVYAAYHSTWVDDYKPLMQIEVMTEFNSPAYAKDNVHLWNRWEDINNASVMTVEIWSNSFKTINRANIVLGKGEKIEMDESLKTQYFAEARFIRGLSYYNLVRMYGGVPIPGSFTEDLKGLSIPRKTVEETYAYIIADLEFAEQNLPKKSEYAADDVWRVSQGAVQALLGDVYLTLGTRNADIASLQKSKDYSNKVIQSNEYTLEPNFKDLWYWWNTNNENGVESIFEIQTSNFYETYNRLHTYFGVNATEYTLGALMYRRMGPSISHYLSYDDLDARKEGGFLTEYNITSDNGSTIIETASFNPDDKGFYPSPTGWKTASPGNLKFYDRTELSATSGAPAANFYVLRYAQVLLNYAEAENLLNGPGSAYSALNGIRNRADLPSLSGLSQTAFDDAVYKERGFEFIGEGKLFFDELRTDRIGDNVEAHVQWGIDNGIFMYDTPLQYKPNKNFLFKIPVFDLDSNPELEQNPDN